MSKVLLVLRSRWFLTAIGATAVGAMIWLLADGRNWLGGHLSPTVMLLLLPAIWAMGNAAMDAVRRRKDALLASGAVADHGTASASSGQEKEEVAELRHRMERAMKLLRGSRGARGYLYEQPWYVIIGPPGAGKTTMLGNAGLNFPLAGELGQGELRGVGGTRLCDWSFTDDAVLIDTAGRYTTQDSSAAVDRAGWEGFLDLLKSKRKLQPLNGVIVAIGLCDLAAETDGERQAHARAIRNRIKELNTRLGVKLPVYVLFTKADLIRGFVEFFDDLDRNNRGQVWGMTFPLAEDEFGPVGRFGAEYQSLISQLSTRLVDRLQGERSLERRSLLMGFPTEMAAMEPMLTAFLTEAFGGFRLDPAPMLRGIYFASAAQQGSPMDRLAASLARSFGIDQRRQEAPPRSGRSYFVERLFKDVIFGEAMLVARSAAATRRWLWIRGTIWGLCGLLLVGGSAWMGYAAWESAAATTRYQEALDKYDATYQALSKRQGLNPVPLGGADIIQVLPLLDQARAVVTAAQSDDAGLFLSQRSKLEPSALRLYDRTLSYVLLPRLVSLMESQMRVPNTPVNELYRMIGPYKMLCCNQQADPKALHAWLVGAPLDSPSKAQFDDLMVHADALFGGDRRYFDPMLTPVSHDAGLVSTVEAKIGNLTVGDLVYTRIKAAWDKTQPKPVDVPNFSPERAIGRMEKPWFIRRSGAKLQDPIDGFYTPAGFRNVLLAHIEDEIVRAVDESTRRGQDAVSKGDLVKHGQIESDVIKAYTKDYNERWHGLLDDLDVVPPSAGTAIADFSVLTSPTGPIVRLLNAVSANLTLAPPPKPAQGSEAPDEHRDPQLSGSAVDTEFEELRNYIGGQLPIDLGTLGRMEARIEQTIGGVPGAAPIATPTLQFNAPPPVGGWLNALQTRGNTVQSTTQRQQTASVFGAGGGVQDQCRLATRNFPFRPTAKQDVTLEDFAALFGRDQGFDGFFKQYLTPFVSKGPGAWRVHDAGATSAPIDGPTALLFQNAADIRDAFFGAGGNQPQIRFALRQVSLTGGARQVTLDLGGQRKSYAADAAADVDVFEWPGPTRMTSVRLLFDPPGSGPALEYSGTWALFRLLKDARVEPTGDDHTLRMTFTQGERRAVFELSTASDPYPFRASLLEKFTCPTLKP